jgi:hypothetical protein
VRTLPDGTVMRRITEIAVPTLRLVPNPFARDARQFDRVEALTWTLPIDDTHFRLYSAGRVTVPGSFKPRVEGVDLLANYNWHVMTPAERQARPGDYPDHTAFGGASRRERHRRRDGAAPAAAAARRDGGGPRSDQRRLRSGGAAGRIPRRQLRARRRAAIEVPA